uniref:Uncharacterized protein n=1 Tax=Psychrobacter sp. (strain PRwf-1) TaxID=349106 RepID=A5WCS9_PSYWF
MKEVTLNIAYKLLANASVFSILGVLSQNAMAADCPIIDSFNQLQTLGTQDGENVYFCKQTTNFPPNQFMIQTQPEALVSGGSQSIVIGNATQTLPIQQSSINLAGPAVTGLNLNVLNIINNSTNTTNFPLSGGKYNKAEIFNFYTRVRYSTELVNRCDNSSPNEYTKIKTYLRNNASSIFKAKNLSTNTIKSATAVNSGNDIAEIKDAEIGLKNSKIKADITFYHINPNTNGQYFSSGSDRFCWVGISTRIKIKDDATNINDAGTYAVDIGVYKP